MKPKIILSGRKIFAVLVLVSTGTALFMAVLDEGSLESAEDFYASLILGVIFVSMILFVLKVFHLIKSTKKLFKIFIACLIICAAGAVGYEAGYKLEQNHREKFARVGEQKLNLADYAPFAKDTKAVKLKEPSNFKITGNLPKLDGATALYPVYAAFVQAVYPEQNYPPFNKAVYPDRNPYEQMNQPLEAYIGNPSLPTAYDMVICTTTPYAYSNLINGKADIVFGGRPSEYFFDTARKKGIELKLTPIGLGAFVFFVNAENKVDGLSVEQIQDIYAGKITNWQQVGGKDEPIRAFQRPANSGSQTRLLTLMGERKLMNPPKEDVWSTMGTIVHKTANYRNYGNAIGYSFLFFVAEMERSNQIRLLKVNGVYPDKETIKNKTYPLTSEIFAVTAGSNNENIEPFIEWMLSPQGQYLVEATGYTAVGK